MIYTKQRNATAMVIEDEVKEIKEIAEKHGMDYIIATNDYFTLLPKKVCTVCITRWTERKFNYDRFRMVEAANNALGEAMKFCEAHPKYRISDISATGFEIEQVAE